MTSIPVITIDGPSGCGKGTIAQLLAKKLKMHFLDSGALYRAVALAVMQAKIEINHHDQIQNLVNHLNIQMRGTDHGECQIFMNNQDITHEIRSEACGQMASLTSAIPLVRAALLDRQRQFRKPPGLVTDGRDMGTTVFPDALLKFYLTADVTERAKRRYNQLNKKGDHVSLPDILKEMQMRDERDSNRAISPLKPADDVVVIDTTHLNVSDAFESVLQHVRMVFVI